MLGWRIRSGQNTTNILKLPKSCAAPRVSVNSNRVDCSQAACEREQTAQRTDLMKNWLICQFYENNAAYSDSEISWRSV